MENIKIKDVISKEYKTKLTEYHSSNKKWGGAVTSKTAEIHKLMILTDSKSVLDYGAGSSAYLDTMNAYNMDLPYSIHEYEPGREELSGDPPVVDFTVCCDVLEHVEPAKVDITLQHIANKTRKFAYFTICLVPSSGTFSDGTNLHLTIHPADWWLKKLEADWEIITNTTTWAHLVLCLKRKSK